MKFNHFLLRLYLRRYIPKTRELLEYKEGIEMKMTDEKKQRGPKKLIGVAGEASNFLADVKSVLSGDSKQKIAKKDASDDSDSDDSDGRPSKSKGGSKANGTPSLSSRTPLSPLST